MTIRKIGRSVLVSIVALWSFVALGAVEPAQAQSQRTAVTGFVYYDLNGNGRPDPGEPRAAHVLVDAGFRQGETRSIPVSTTTDANGTYSLDLTSLIAPPFAPGSAMGDVSAGVSNVVGGPIATGGSSFPFLPGQTATVNIGLHFVGTSHGPTPFVIDAVFQSYFDHRGGVSTFGYPVSRLFLFQGFPTQIFQRAVLQRWPDGSVHLLNLLDPGLMPFNSFNGAIVPAFDPSLVAQAPAPGSPKYISQVMRFIDEKVPNTFDGQPVNFHQRFLGTVTAATAFPPIHSPAYCSQHGLPSSSCTTPPGYGDVSLLPGFDLEIWGIPTSRPMRDPHNHDFVYQRFQRGIMHYQGNLGVTEGLLLGDYFKSILTGQNLPPDLAQEATGSHYLRQYCVNGPHWICRPQELAPSGTDLTGAFAPESAQGH